MTTYKEFLRDFMAKFIWYCKEHRINISALCRNLESKNIHCAPQKLYNMRNGYYNGTVTVYTFVALCNAINLSMLEVLNLSVPKK